jgi:hypothetical protein
VFSRTRHCCGNLRKGRVIVAGGFNGTVMSSVEILKVGES